LNVSKKDLADGPALPTILEEEGAQNKMLILPQKMGNKINFINFRYAKIFFKIIASKQFCSLSLHRYFINYSPFLHLN
jgi:hypothetical protein